MSFEVTGILTEKFSTVDVSGKFKKREFIISRTENSNGFEFTDYIKFQLTQDRTGLIEPYSTGDLLKVSFNIRGRKWENAGKTTFFTNLEAWKIEKKSLENDSEPGNTFPSESIPLPGEDDLSTPSENIEDLPF